jgi:hypothetical protein
MLAWVFRLSTASIILLKTELALMNGKNNSLNIPSPESGSQVQG